MKIKKLKNEITWEFRCHQCKAHVVDIKVDELQHDLHPKPYYTCPNCSGINRPKKSRLTVNKMRELQGYEEVKNPNYQYDSFAALEKLFKQKERHSEMVRAAVKEELEREDGK